MASYITRLADVHGVTCSQLVFLLTGSRTLGNLNGCSGYAESTLLRLVSLTSRDELTYGTLVRFRAILSRNTTGSVVNHRRWCSACLREQMQEGTVLYDHLAWSISALENCAVHRTRLCGICAHCGARQPMCSSKKDWRLYCISCRSSLVRDDHPGSKSTSPLEEWRAAEVGELLSRDSLSHLPVDQIARAVRVLCLRFGHVRGVADQLHLNRSNLIRLTSENAARPTLDTLLKIAAGMRVSVAQLIDTPGEAARQGWLDVGEYQFSSKAHPRIPAGVRGALKRKLTRATSKLRPPSLASVCREVGVSVGYAQQVMPALVKRLSEARDVALVTQRSITSKLVKQAVEDAVHSTPPDGLSRKRLVLRMMKETGLPKRKLSAELRNFLLREPQSEHASERKLHELRSGPSSP